MFCPLISSIPLTISTFLRTPKIHGFRGMFLKPFNKLAGRVLSGLKPLGYASWLYTTTEHSRSFITVRRALPRPPNKHFLQVSQSRYANLIDRHASIKSFNTQLPNENLSILTDKVEAKAQQLYKT